MSEEMFEKNFKDGLENYKSKVSPKVWQNVKTALPMPWYLALSQNLGWKLYGLATSMAILVMGYNLTQVWDKLQALENTKKSPIVRATEHTQTISRIDTLVITKTIYVREQSQRLLPEKYELSRKGRISENPSLELQQFSQKKDNTVQIQTDQLNVGKSTSNETFNLEKSGNKVSGSLKTNTPIQFEMINTSESKPTHETKDELIIPSKEMLGNSVKEKEISQIIDSVKHYIDTKTNNVSENHKLRWRPNLRPRVGLNAEYSNPYSYAFGPTLEVFVSNDISISGGIKAKFLHEMEYESGEEYNFINKTNFETKYVKYLPQDYENIDDIEFNSTKIELPLAVNYYQYLGKNLSIQYSMGGKIDLSVIEDIEVELEKDIAETAFAFSSTKKMNSWSQVSAGVGLQYQLKRFIFQLQPSMAFNFYKYESIQKGVNFQLRAGILFDLRSFK
ncbi:hypothetical protein MCERE19_01569 [Spirosomataceae bacterium]|jgi:hypothetical protein